MKRFAVLACLVTPLVLIALVVFREVTKRGPGHGASAEAIAQMDAKVRQFVDIQTEPVGQEAFEAAVRDRAQSSIESLTELERGRLYGCIHRFYQCYFSGDFNAYAKFRLFAPGTVKPSLKSFVERMGYNPNALSEEDILRIAWDKINGTNMITSCEPKSISLRVEERQDTGGPLHFSSTALRDGAFPGAITWSGAVKYDPTAESLLVKEGTIRLFRLELNVRMNNLQVGPATPVVVVGYWDPTRGDWMPLSYSAAFRVADYNTIF